MYTVGMRYMRVALAVLMGLAASAPVSAAAEQAVTPSNHQSAAVALQDNSACPTAGVTDKRIYFVTCGGFF